MGSRSFYPPAQKPLSRFLPRLVAFIFVPTLSQNIKDTAGLAHMVIPKEAVILSRFSMPPLSLSLSLATTLPD